MPDFKCQCTPDEIVTEANCIIRHVPGKGVVNNVICKHCGEHMELANPKSGCAGFSSNRYGQL